MPDPNLFTARALRQVMADAGIAISGTTRSTTDSMRYRQARTTPPLAEITSRPFREWVFPILNRSQNWFAEMVLKQLGRQFGRAGSWDEGVAVERRFLIDSVKVDSTEFRLQDGSGLSSGNLVSPLAFTRILRYIRMHPRAQTFLAGLPRSGNVGSLHSRFMDAADHELPPLRAFVLPAGTPKAAALHLARTVCRRAERSVVTLARQSGVPPMFVVYLNRLSDLLFTLARLANHREGAGDVTW